MQLLPQIPVHAQVYAHLAAVALSFAFITYMQVLVGELVPKSLALRRAEALAVAVAPADAVLYGAGAAGGAVAEELRGPGAARI